MSVIIGNQLGLFHAIETDQTPVYDWVKYVKSDDDITDGLYKYIDYLFSQKLLVLDLETYGKDYPENGSYKTDKKEKWKLKDYALSPIYGDIRLFQLGTLNNSQVLVIDFHTKWDKLSSKYINFIEYVKQKALEFSNNKGTFIGHNIGFDLGFLRAKWGIKVWKAWDTMIMSQLLYAGILSYRHGLKDCCQRELNLVIDKTEQSSDFSLELRNSQINYAANDIVYTKDLFIELVQKIKKAELQKVAEIEAQFTPVLVEMNYWGMPVNLEELDRQIKWYQNQLSEFDAEFQKMYPGQNIKSSEKVGEITSALYEDEDDEFCLENPMEGEVKIKKGSSKSELALLGDHRVVQIVTDYRKVTKFLEYAQQVKQEIVWIEGVPRVSGQIGQLTRKGQGRTRSGNKNAPVKCQGVNLQNAAGDKSLNERLIALGCPRIRDIFRVPEGFKMVDMDLPAAHLAIATYMAGEKDVPKGVDRHAITMKCVFDEISSYEQYKHLSVLDISEINNDKNHKLHKSFKKIRTLCKSVVYSGLNYGSAPTLQTTIKVETKEEIPLDVCEVMVNAFPKVLPDIAALRETLWKKANNSKIEIDGKHYGIFQDDYGTYSTPGYRRRIYSACKTNSNGSKIYVPKGDIANCWLATESSSVKMSIAKIYQQGVLTGKYDLRLSSICHDEVILYCKESDAIEVALLTRDSMREGLEYFTGNGKIPYPDMMKEPELLITDAWEH